jgi:hypothetical protein
MQMAVLLVARLVTSKDEIQYENKRMLVLTVMVRTGDGRRLYE